MWHVNDEPRLGTIEVEDIEDSVAVRMFRSSGADHAR